MQSKKTTILGTFRGFAFSFNLVMQNLKLKTSEL